MELTDLPIHRFDTVVPGTADADRLRWDLERVIFPLLHSRGTEGLVDAVSALNALGHSLESQSASAPGYRYTESVANGQVELEIAGVISPEVTSLGVSLRSLIPPTLTPAAQRAEELRSKFYAEYERVGPTPLENYDRLLEAERVVYCVGGLEAEVNNGGFAQYFQNTEGLHAEDTLNVLYAIGADEVAELLATAIEMLLPAHAGTREALLDRLDQLDSQRDSALDRLDEKFCETRDDLSVLAWTFVADDDTSS